MRYPNVTFYLVTKTSYTYYKIQKSKEKQTVKKQSPNNNKVHVAFESRKCRKLPFPT